MRSLSCLIFFLVINSLCFAAQQENDNGGIARQMSVTFSDLLWLYEPALIEKSLKSSVRNYDLKGVLLQDEGLREYHAAWQGESGVQYRRSDSPLQIPESESLKSIHQALVHEGERLGELILLLTPAEPAITLSEKERTYLSKHPIIRVSNELDFPPYDFVVEGTPQGYNIDLLKLIGEKIGVEIEFVSGYSWTELMKLFKQGDLDLVHAVKITPDRLEYALFSDPYRRLKTYFVTPAAKGDITDIKQLYGKTFAVGEGWSQEEFLEKNYPQINLLRVDNALQMLEAVSSGKADVTAGSGDVLRYIMKKHGIRDLEIGQWFKEIDEGQAYTHHFMAKRTDPELISIVNKALVTLSVEDLDTLERKWFGEPQITFSSQRSMLLGLLPGERQYLKEVKQLSYCVDPNWMPYEQINEKGEHEGLSHDLMQELGTRMGISMRLVPTKSWSQSLDYIKRGRCTLLAAAAETATRQQFLDFTQPYHESSIVVAVRNEELFVENLASIKDEKLGVVKGYAFRDMILERYPRLILVEVDSVSAGLAMVRNRELFGFVDSVPAIGYQMRREGIVDLKIGGKLEMSLPLAIAVRQDEDPELVNILNKALDSFSEEERQHLADKWFSILEIEKKFDYTRLWPVLAGIIVLFVIALYREQKLAEHARLNKELMQSREEAEKANRAKSKFLANMSHELRTPLHAILGFSELLMRDSSIPSEQQESLETINRSGNHLLALINDILDLSKIEAGRIELQISSFDLYDFLSSLEDMFRLRAREKGLTLFFERAPEVPRYIRTDQNKLRQVLINILGNAVKFTATGEVTLKVSRLLNRSDESEASNQVRLHWSITDTGAGIAAEELKNVFELFSQTRSGLQSQQGTGLGMPISRKFVHMMGGDISVCSEPGMGSTFTFDILAEAVEHYTAKAAPMTYRAIGLEEGQPVFRLLIVEDEAVNRKLLAKLLQSYGFDIREAVNGKEAIAIWQAWNPDLIWMDIRMPVMDGLTATRQIRNSPGETSKVPVIALTAGAFEEQREKVLEAGCNDFICKPFHETDIFRAIRKHLNVRFVYEEYSGLSVNRPGEERDTVRVAEELGNIPAGILQFLEDAIEMADIAMMKKAIEQIRSYDVSLADTLGQMVKKFDYDGIIDLIKKEDR